MKPHKVLLVFLTLLLVMLAVFSGASAKPASQAVVTLAVDQAAFAAGQEVIVYVTIANPTGHTIKVLAWYTPIPEVEGPLFAVTLDGQAVAYTGAIYKRPAPAAGLLVRVLHAADLGQPAARARARAASHPAPPPSGRRWFRW